MANGGRVGSSGINKTRPILLGPVRFVGFGPWGTLGMAPPRVVLEVRWWEYMNGGMCEKVDLECQHRYP